MSNKEILKAVLRNDFYSFVQKVFHEITGGEKFIPNWHLEVLCYQLEQARLGKTKRLIINVPPRSLKSVIVNVAFTAWVLGHNPSEKLISASYSSDLSEKFARDTKRVMDSHWYKDLFPKSVISKERSSATDFVTISRGGRFATSVEGTLTGRGGNFIIIDDPIKPNEVMSETALNKVNEWYRNTLLSRLDDKEKGVIILVMQRVHENDLTGYLLENPDNWKHIKMPQIAIEDETWDIGTKVFRRPRGNLLNKTQIDLPTVLKLKQEFGSYVWEGQYQQEPCPIEGGIIKEEWIQYYSNLPSERDITDVLISWDTGNKTGENNAYSACCVFAFTRQGKFYLLEVIRGKYEMPQLIEKMAEVYHKWKYEYNAGNIVKMLIEDKASGTQAIQILRQGCDSQGYSFNIETVIPNDDKVSRLKGASVYIEMGYVLFPKEEYDWWKDFKKELLGFPGTKYKDQVDAFTQCITFFQKQT